ncbi:PREDICTED: uncharacterized protein LOC104807804 [Tarenaya hassleriana]|uniref:uncharacterized protein LOC104807804 n=1 Tax=Tarenaya hassleriana TaxID=28532 RepID=UPI00053C9D20|nr:PREDICTED: uncharacterized protein LOC104807804 [Tarenaya hassleriana]
MTFMSVVTGSHTSPLPTWPQRFFFFREKENRRSGLWKGQEIVMMWCGSLSLAQGPAFNMRLGHCRRLCSRAEAPQNLGDGDSYFAKKNTKKVVVVGSGWAGLGAAHHLCNQGFDVTVLDDGRGGLNTPDDVGIQGFWYPYRNIFSLVDELGVKPFTSWTTSAQYSVEGLEVEFPVFRELPQLPTPLGTLYYTQFARLPLMDKISSLPLMAAAIDFDNTDAAWRKYDPVTARELLKQLGCSKRLYRDIFRPLLQVGLFAPPEQCSAAAMLALLYYVTLSHQKDFNMVWCRGTVQEKIFEPWMESLKDRGCRFLRNKSVTDFTINEESGSVTEVVCGRDTYAADAVILAVTISALQETVKKSAALCKREEFLKVLNLTAIDVVSVKLKLDRKVAIPHASNACSAPDESYGWTFFDLSAIYDEHREDEVTVVRADFYHGNELMGTTDEVAVTKTMSYLSKCVKGFENAVVVDADVQRFPHSLSHFFPGSYKYMMRGSTSFPNMFMAGDWVITRHGSWSQEKSYVTGLEATNRVVDFLGEGSFAKVIPIEGDEPHVEALRTLNRRFHELASQLPLSSYFLQ